MDGLLGRLRGSWTGLVYLCSESPSASEPTAPSLAGTCRPGAVRAPGCGPPADPRQRVCAAVLPSDARGAGGSVRRARVSAFAAEDVFACECVPGDMGTRLSLCICLRA